MHKKKPSNKKINVDIRNQKIHKKKVIKKRRKAKKIARRQN